jgi:hypothetical protein
LVASRLKEPAARPDGLAVAKLIELFGRIDGPQLLGAGKAGAFAKGRTQEVETISV